MPVLLTRYHISTLKCICKEENAIIMYRMDDPGMAGISRKMPATVIAAMPENKRLKMNQSVL